MSKSTSGIKKKQKKKNRLNSFSNGNDCSTFYYAYYDIQQSECVNGLLAKINRLFSDSDERTLSTNVLVECVAFN